MKLSKVDVVKELSSPEISKDDPNERSFHHAIGPVIAFGQIFGLVPVDGILSKDETDLNFRWKSFKTYISITYLIFGFIESATGTRRLFRLGFNLQFADGLLYFLTALVRGSIFFFLGKKWKAIMQKWKKYEIPFLSSPYEVTGLKLSTQIRVIFVVAMLAALTEHSFYLVTAIVDNKTQIEQCDPYSEIFWDNFLARNRPHLRYHFGYSPFLLPLYEIVNLWQTFCWNYADIFIALLAVGINFRFKQFNRRFRQVLNDNQQMSLTATFKDLRLHYFNLIDLTYFVDSQVSIMILISMGHNTMVLLLRIFDALKPNRYNPLNDLYFWFYMSYLVSRILFMLLSSAFMHDNAMQTVNLIRGVPTRYWTLDLQRLYDTIVVEAPSLSFSGKRLFYITKKSVLALIGTILTFEIFLLDEVTSEIQPFCAKPNKF